MPRKALGWKFDADPDVSAQGWIACSRRRTHLGPGMDVLARERVVGPQGSGPPETRPASIVRDLSPLLSLTPRKAAMDGGLPACGRANFRSPETSQEVSGGKSLGQRLSDGAT